MPTDLPPRVLCIDDDQDSCLMLTALLKQLSIEAMSVGNGTDALDLARREHFDLYLIDTWIPGTDGIELCRTLRALDPKIPIIFYSGDTQIRIRELARKAGANAYVFKPRFDELFQRIAHYVFPDTALAA
jgi:CheY-like chemotaxis protein